MFDLYMRALCNGKEREKQDWIDLITEADPNFHIRAFAEPLGSNLGIIDVQWQGDSENSGSFSIL